MSLLGTVDLGVFVAAGLILNITPGADMLYIAGRSSSQGAKAGVIAALGTGTGCMAHVLFATFGLSVVLATSAIAFSIVKYAGAAYLVYLGIATLLAMRSGTDVPAGLPVVPLSPWRIFQQAVLINILNPKVALFFMALLPQFVSPQAAHPAISFLFLGVLFDFNGTIVNVVFAIFSAKIASRLRGCKRLGLALKTAVGALFIGLGVRLALTSQK